jgi:hypothetical protein
MKFPDYDFDIAIHHYADHLVANYNKTGYMPNSYAIEFKRGSKFLKVISAHKDGHRSVHSFICVKADDKFKFGDILKAAGWAQPAKNFARGSVLETESYTHLSWAGI